MRLVGQLLPRQPDSQKPQVRAGQRGGGHGYHGIAAGAAEGCSAGGRQGGEPPPGSVPACGAGPIWDVSEALQRALGRQQQVVLGLLLSVTASESCSSLSKVCILGVGAVPLQCPGDSRGGSLLVLLQAPSSLPTGQPLEPRFLPVLWSLVLQQSFCSRGQRDLWLSGCWYHPNLSFWKGIRVNTSAAQS